MKKSGITVYPNPTNDMVSVTFNISRKQSYRIQLTELSGKVLLQQDGSAGIGENKIQLNIKQFTSGTYLIKFSNDEMSEQTLKVIKQ